MKNFLTGILPQEIEKESLEIIKNQHKVVLRYLESRGLVKQIDPFLLSTPEKLSNLWHNGTIFRYLLHQSQDESISFNDHLAQMKPPYEIQDFKFDNLHIKVIENSYLLEYLYKYFKHPDFDKTENALYTGFANEEDRNAWYQTLSNALSLVKDTDELQYQMLESYLDCISPVHFKLPLVKGNVISFTSDYSIGLIVYSQCPKILTAETLIHETRHNLLFTLMEAIPLIKDNTVLVKTPLRDDARPLSGLFHQAYVLCGLSRFYSRILNFEEYGKMENVIKRANLQYHDYAFSLNVLNENLNYLTETGIQLFDMLKEDLKNYQ
jgi:hypothetical protein